jgi:ABC-2 type transport system permease protein/oleandomycin transport system permease protein
MFASNAVVPIATLPSWLQDFARIQPLSVTVAAVRGLFLGTPAAHWVWQSLAWSAGILVVFFIVAVRLYRNATQ